VLSAVDAHVGKTIFDQCILKMKSKTRLLVTNNLHVLSRVDKVIVLVDGVVREVGPMKELLKNDQGALSQIMKEMAKIEEYEELSETPGRPPLLAQHSEPELYQGEQERQISVKDEEETEQEDDDPFAANNPDEMEFRFRQQLLEPQKTFHRTAESAKLTAKETRVRGKISNKVLKSYWLAGTRNSYILVLLLLLCFFVAEGVFLAVDAYLASASQQKIQVDTSTFLITYSCLTVGAIVGILLRSFGFALFHLAAVSVLYESASKRILRFPMTFYWKEPLGRLLNRLSADTNVMDTMLGSR
jgi:ATP-binding cassette subfamily C (CFTR/MRP) protein 1